jgi:23S rRNA (adenine-N6)-dimethyltransferase
MKKKKLPIRFTGQHFTIDKVLINDAISQANLNIKDTVLDIGAGKGFLTVHLLQKAKKVIAIENDIDLAKILRKKFNDSQIVQIVVCDFKYFEFPKNPFKVVSNIPYGITSEILKKLMYENLLNFLGGTIILQSEPAKKLFSKKIYNPLCVFYHTFYDLKFLYEINPQSFLPPPTVNSALLKITKKKQIEFSFELKDKYFDFISYLLKKPNLSVRLAFKTIFRKKQIWNLSKKFGIDLNDKIVCLTTTQWKSCFLEMVEIVPENFHPL